MEIHCETWRMLIFIHKYTHPHAYMQTYKKRKLMNKLQQWQQRCQIPKKTK